MKTLRKKEVPGANLFHDRVNLICLPVLAAMSAAGLLGFYSPEKVQISLEHLFISPGSQEFGYWAEYSTMPTTAYLPQRPEHLIRSRLIIILHFVKLS